MTPKDNHPTEQSVRDKIQSEHYRLAVNAYNQGQTGLVGNATEATDRVMPIINAHIVSVLEDIRTSLEEENLAFHGRNDCKSCHAIEQLDAAIKQHQPKGGEDE